MNKERRRKMGGEKPWLALGSDFWWAVERGVAVRIRMPCDEDVWRDLVTMCKAGQVEIVVRKKREGS